MSVKLLTEHHFEFLSLKGGCTGSSESTLVNIQHCLKSHVAAQLSFNMRIQKVFFQTRSNFDNFFVFHYQRANIGTPAKRHLNSETPFKWRFAGVPMMAQH